MLLHCKPSLRHLVHPGIWNIYHNYMNKWKDMQVSWNVCVLCFSAQWNSHLGISVSHISSTNQSKQQFTPWRVLHRKLDFIISELITLESFFFRFPPPFFPLSLWIQNKAIWKYRESTLIKISFGTQCGWKKKKENGSTFICTLASQIQAQRWVCRVGRKNC